jgi:hypothetical protein
MTAAKKASDKHNPLLERELSRKERALAEAAARMILRNNAEANWGLGDSP